MSHLESYTPDICSQLRQLAESRQWHQWNSAKALGDSLDNNRLQQEVLEDVELTYHLHVAAEANGRRAGMPPMPVFPLKLKHFEKPLDPAEFIVKYLCRHPPHLWNRSDNRIRIRRACA